MTLGSWIPRALLHQRAHGVALRLCARFAKGLPEDVRSVVSFWQSTMLAGDRAAEQLLAYARRFGIQPEAPETPSSTELGPWPR
jgi:hypothetical protein